MSYLWLVTIELVVILLSERPVSAQLLEERSQQLNFDRRLAIRPEEIFIPGKPFGSVGMPGLPLPKISEALPGKFKMPPSVPTPHVQNAIKCQKAVELFKPKIAESERSEFREIWETSCLHNETQIERGQLKALRATIVRLEIGNNRRCQGGILNRKYIITARHCFSVGTTYTPTTPISLTFPVLTSSPARRLQIVDRNVRISGVTSDGTAWSDDNVVLKMDPVSHDDAGDQDLERRKKEYPQSLDYVVLERANHDTFPVNGLSLASSTEMAELSPTSQLIMAMYEDAPAKAGAMLIDDFPWCRIKAIHYDKGFISHPCQTLETVSGTPLIWASSTGMLKIIGVHTGRIGDVVPAFLGLWSNEGVMLSETVRNLP